MKEGSFREGRAQRRSGEEIPTRPIKNNSEINTVNAKTAAVGLGAQLIPSHFSSMPQKGKSHRGPPLSRGSSVGSLLSDKRRGKCYRVNNSHTSSSSSTIFGHQAPHHKKTPYTNGRYRRSHFLPHRRYTCSAKTDLLLLYSSRSRTFSASRAKYSLAAILA